MEKKSLLTANWLKAVFLLMVMCFSGLYAQASTTNTVDLDYLVPGQTYTIDANTIVTGRYFGTNDGTITLTSSVAANTNLVPYTDNTYSDIIESVRDEEARSKSFVFVAGNRGATVYFKSVVSTTPYEVRFDYVRASNLEDYLDSIIPEDGQVVSSLKDFTMNFTTKIYGVNGSAKLYKGEELVAEKVLENAQNTNTYSFSFDEEITAAGEYTLVIPEETLTIGMSMRSNSEWKFNYTVVEPQPEMLVSLVGGNTAEEAVVFNNLNATVTFKNIASAEVVDKYVQIGLRGIVPSSTIETCYVEYAVTKISDTEYVLTPNADQLANLNADAYKFTIPAEYFRYDDGTFSPVYETWVKYEAPSFDPVTITFSPVAGTEDAPADIEVADVSNFTLSFSGAESVAASVAATKEDSAIYLKFWNDYWLDWDKAIAFKPEFTDAFTCKLVPFDEYWATNIEMLASGKYQLCIPAGTFVYNGNETNVNITTSAYYKLVLPDVTVSPESGSVIEVVDNSGLMNVYVRFNNETQVTASQTVKATLKKDGEVLEEVLGQVNWAQRNTLAFWFATNHIESGEYEFIVPGDIVTLGSGKAFEGLTATYTIAGATPATPTIVVTPQGGTEEEPVEITTFEFIVKAENATRVDYANGGGWMAINGWVTSRNGSEGYFNSMWPTITRIDDTTLKFTLDNYTIEEILEGSTNGKYQLYISAGDLWFNGDDTQICEEVALIYSYNSGVTTPEMVISPAVGSEVASIEAETITIEFKNVDEVVVNTAMLDFNNDPLCIIIDPSFNWISVYPVAVEGETNEFKLVPFDGQPAYPFTTEGQYGLWIPDGTFIVNGEEFAGEYYEEYISVATVSEAKMIVTPEDGATIESYEDIRISFENVSKVEVNPSALNADMGKVMLIPDDDWMNLVVVKPVAVEGETNTYKLEIIDGQFPATFNSVLFYMEEGTFFMDGADSPAIEYTYKKAATQPKMIVTPANGAVLDIINEDTFRITFEGVDNVAINPAFTDWNGDPLVTLYSLTPEGYAGTMTNLKPVAVEGATNEFKFEVFAESAAQFPITENGTWCLWIPEGTFTMDGIPSPDFGAEYTLAPYKYTAEPAEGYVLSLDAVSLTFEPGIEVINADVEGEVVLYKDNSEVETIALSDLTLAGWGASGSSLVIPFSKVYAQAGEYRVEIPANVVTLTGGITNNAITLNYTIGGLVQDWTAVADPAPGVVEEITTIMVTFQGASQLTVDSAAGPNDFPYYATVAEDGTLTKVPYSVFTFLEGANQISLTVQNEESKLSEPGKYAFIIPATYCLVDGVQMTEDIRFDYVIEGAQPEYEVVITPSTGEIVKGDQLYVITVTFEGAKSIELDGSKAATLYQIDEFGGAMTNIYVTTSCEGNVATFNVNELHKPYLDAAGTFQFTIPVGMVIITDANDVVGKNKENIVATWESEGLSVDTIGVDAKDLNIYNVNGMLIKRNGTYEDVKALERGIYIINGQKYYVK